LTLPEFFIAATGVVSAVFAVAVVASRNVVRAALYLVGVLGGLGIIFLLLGAEFVGWTQILVYVGAIVVLLLFGLMLTAAPIGRYALDNQQRLLAFLVSSATFAGFTIMIWNAFGEEEIPLNQIVRTKDVGTSMFTNAVLPFELVSVLLLAALVGAILLAKKD
jgi:NADH-quinone oxidoreductase subunit J